MISSRKILLNFSGGSGLDFIKSVSIKAFSAIALLVSSSLLARSLAPAGFGAYTYIFSTTTIFLAPVSVALGNVILRDLGRIQSTALGMHEMNRHISTALVVMCVLLVLPMTWIVWSVRDIGVDFRGWYGTSIIALCGVLVVSMALNGVVASIFQVHNEIALSNAINALVRPMLFLLIVGAPEIVVSPSVIRRGELPLEMLNVSAKAGQKARLLEVNKAMDLCVAAIRSTTKVPLT